MGALFILLFSISNMSFAMSPREALESFHSALAINDKAKAISLLSPNATIYESGYVEHTRQEYIDQHLAGDIDFAKTTKRKSLQSTEKLDKNFAIIWNENEVNGKIDGQEINSLGTETAVLEKHGNEWKIVHFHWSSRKKK